MAMVNPRVTVEVINIEAFPDLVPKYRIGPIPKTVINETTFLEGAAPERLVQHASCADFLSSDEMRQLARRLETLGRTPDLVVGAAPSPVAGGGH